jgi:membrane-associated phospholipid phosphatase
MPRLLGALLIIALTRAAAAQRPPHYLATWEDGVSVAAAGALAVIPEAAGLPHGPPPCGVVTPCDPSTLLGIDHAALHTSSSGAGTASTLLLAGVGGFAGLASLEGTDAARLRGHVAVFANAVGWTAASSEWLKVLFHRSRPVLYTPNAPGAAPDADNRRSMPSEHASLAFSVATAYLVMAGRERLPHRARNAALLYAGALGVAALRVAAGQHFPTDVAGGALLGSGVGWLAARFHPMAP